MVDFTQKGMETEAMENIVVIVNDKVDASGEPVLPEKGLNCTFCNWKFSSKQNLKRHVKEQHLGFRFPCQKCDAEFGRKEDIIRHYSIYHPNNIQEISSIKQISMTTEDGHVKPRVKIPELIRKPRRKIKKDDPKLKAVIQQRPKRNRIPKDPKIKMVFSQSKTGSSPEKKAGSSPARGKTCKREYIATGNSSEPERVVVALDPATQFRLERVIAERVNMITENVVIETLDGCGQVTKRETIERKYHLNQDNMSNE